MSTDTNMINHSLPLNPVEGQSDSSWGVFLEGTTQGSFLNWTGNTSINNSTIVPLKPDPPYATWLVVIISNILAFLIAGTILGNILVCTAVGIVHKLRTPSNLLIVSLAVADLLVAILVMPFAAAYEVTGYWAMGQLFCDTWTCLDVMLCTASILNLCMISVDRYFVITRPFQYAMKRTPKRMALMITCVWVSSALISIPPLMGWRPDHEEGNCSVSQNIGYQFYATIGAFYFPLAVMIFIYYRIYMVSSRMSNTQSKPARSRDNSYQRQNEPSSSQQKGSNRDENHNNSGAVKKNDESTVEMLPKKTSNSSFKFLKRLTSVYSSRERKATKTLGVIMGAFMACWLPFFILALIKPFCNNPNECIPLWLNSLFLWLGYANSCLNPIIYARFNRDFRTPFKEILLCRCRGINASLRVRSYMEQYGGAPSSDNLRDQVQPVENTSLV